MTIATQISKAQAPSNGPTLIKQNKPVVATKTSLIQNQPVKSVGNGIKLKAVVEKKKELVPEEEEEIVQSEQEQEGQQEELGEEVQEEVGADGLTKDERDLLAKLQMKKKVDPPKRKLFVKKQVKEFKIDDETGRLCKMKKSRTMRMLCLL